MNNRLTFLGTGTSQGVPMIGCSCEVCKSTDPRDNRLRASVFVEYEGQRILVDAGPDFRQQLLRENISSVDAILLTHNHKDHTGGLDDIRAFNYFEKRATDIYCEKYVEQSLRQEYSYAFAEVKYPGAPDWNVHTIDENPFCINGVKIIPIRGKHYKLPVLGYRFGSLAYCTDMNHIADEEFEKLRGLDHFIINCVRRGRHISHYSLEGALEVAQKVGARHTWLTHLSHQIPKYEDLMRELPEGVKPAYDGLKLDF
jgi:phosphoribosyl 1,2-cyclic phosphate phosphodiesterase